MPYSSKSSFMLYEPLDGGFGSQPIYPTDYPENIVKILDYTDAGTYNITSGPRRITPDIRAAMQNFEETHPSEANGYVVIKAVRGTGLPHADGTYIMSFPDILPDKIKISKGTSLCIKFGVISVEQCDVNYYQVIDSNTFTLLTDTPLRFSAVTAVDIDIPYSERSIQFFDNLGNDLEIIPAEQWFTSNDGSISWYNKKPVDIRCKAFTPTTTAGKMAVTGQLCDALTQQNDLLANMILGPEYLTDNDRLYINYLANDFNINDKIFKGVNPFLEFKTTGALSESTKIILADVNIKTFTEMQRLITETLHTELACGNITPDAALELAESFDEKLSKSINELDLDGGTFEVETVHDLLVKKSMSATVPMTKDDLLSKILNRDDNSTLDGLAKMYVSRTRLSNAIAEQGREMLENINFPPIDGLLGNVIGEVNYISYLIRNFISSVFINVSTWLDKKASELANWESVNNVIDGVDIGFVGKRYVEPKLMPYPGAYVTDLTCGHALKMVALVVVGADCVKVNLMPKIDYTIDITDDIAYGNWLTGVIANMVNELVGENVILASDLAGQYEPSSVAQFADKVLDFLEGLFEMKSLNQAMAEAKENDYLRANNLGYTIEEEPSKLRTAAVKWLNNAEITYYDGQGMLNIINTKLVAAGKRSLSYYVSAFIQDTLFHSQYGMFGNMRYLYSPYLIMPAPCVRPKSQVTLANTFRSQMNAIVMAGAVVIGVSVLGPAALKISSSVARSLYGVHVSKRKNNKIAKATLEKFIEAKALDDGGLKVVNHIIDDLVTQTGLPSAVVTDKVRKTLLSGSEVKIQVANSF